MNTDLDRFVVSLAASTLLWSGLSLGGMLGLSGDGAALRRLGGVLFLAGFVLVGGLFAWQFRVSQEPGSPFAPALESIVQVPATVAAEAFDFETRGPHAAEDVRGIPTAAYGWQLPHEWRNSVRIFSVVWVCGIIGLMAMCVREVLCVECIRRSGRRILRSSRRPILESALCWAPFCTGLIKPEVVLPQGMAAGMDEQELAGLLAHEEAHIRQGDIWLAHVQAGICTFMWWNPLVWVLARWLNRACEESCDQAVVEGALVDRKLYAQSLVKAARHASTTAWQLAPGSAGDFPRLKKRVELILDTEPQPPPGRCRRLSLGVPVLALAAWLGVSAPSPGFGEEAISRQSLEESFARAVEVPPATVTAVGATVAASEAAVEGLDPTVTPSEVNAPAVRPLILIDPGHGGSDSGGRVANVAEKDVVLRLAHRIGAHLSESGLRVAMTRTEDINLGLESRLVLAKKFQPSFFLSVHADRGARFGRSHGLSVVEATNTGLGDAFATALSSAINEAVVTVAPSAFKMVREVSCPSLVLEVGDLSDRRDRARLTDEAKGEVLAKAVAQAVSSVVQGGQMAPRSAPGPNASPEIVHREIVRYPSSLDQKPRALADGFDFPVGAPDAKGYYRSAVHNPRGALHLGEDWNGSGGGDRDLGDPVYAVAHGLVVLSAEMPRTWGNVLIVRHRYLEKDGSEHVCDSMYAHLLDLAVSAGTEVRRGQKIGRIGTANGTYAAHLHFELRKNPAIGMNRSQFAKDISNYWVPKEFIQAHRPPR